MPDYIRRNSQMAALDCPLSISCLDEDGDIGTVELPNNKGVINYADFLVYPPDEEVYVPVERENTLQRRTLYSYISSLLAGPFLLGWGESGASIPADGGGGLCVLYQDTPTGDVNLQVTIFGS